ncbi:hypothetical protein C5167_031193 [Papaver somniferum]|nr:hypothetical protein C5167_031193 [Papaver somniferum]
MEEESTAVCDLSGFKMAVAMLLIGGNRHTFAMYMNEVSGMMKQMFKNGHWPDSVDAKSVDTLMRIPKLIKELKDFLIQACKEKDIEGDLRILLNEQAKDGGILVIKHVNNFPPEHLPPLYNILFNEVTQATKHQLTSWTFTFPLRSRPTDVMQNYKPMGTSHGPRSKKSLDFSERAAISN